MLNETLSAILQILGFALIPFIVYLLKAKSIKGFLSYIGLIKANKRAYVLAVLLSLFFAAPVLILTLTNPDFKEIMLDPNSITGKFRTMGFDIKSMYILIIVAVFKTSFAEEILFRGFIAKRLISLIGYLKGSLLQAAVFGFFHTILFASVTKDIVSLIIIFFIPAIAAYLAVYLNEKIANGSIIPGWISHALANLLAYGLIGFMI